MLIDIPAKILLIILLFIVMTMIIGGVLFSMWQAKYGTNSNTAPVPHKPPQQKE